MRTAFPALVLVAVLVSGCAPAAEVPIQTPSPDGVPLDFQGRAWNVVGGGRFVTGEAVVCPLDTSILIEDFDALVGPDGTPVPSMTFQDGAALYGLSWSGDVQPTGIAAGIAAYTVETDSQGLPLRLTGSGTVTWYDQTSGDFEDRADEFEFTFAAIDTPEYCL